MIPAVVASFLDLVVFGRSYRRAAGALAAFGALAIPSSCVLCGAWDSSLCPRCSALFRAATARPFRAETGAESLPDVEQRPCDVGSRTIASATPEFGTPAVPYGAVPNGPLPYGPLPVVTAGRYGRAVSAVLLAYKNHGHVDLAAPVAAALAGALHHAASAFRTGRPEATPVLIVPVPTRPSSRRRRGYDPLLLLLSRLARSGRLPAGTELVSAVRHLPLPARVASALDRRGAASLGSTVLSTVLGATLPVLRGGQKGLGRRHRRLNVMHSMGASGRTRHAVDGRYCIIVDDVLTTGATIAEMHRVLVAAGARVLGAVVIAATAAPAGDGVPEPGIGPVRRPEHADDVQQATGNFRSSKG